jgi:ClpP class serine protease
MKKAYNFISSVPWICTEESLSNIIQISQRLNEIPNDLKNRVIESIGGTVYAGSNGMVETFGSVAALKIIGPIFRYASMFDNISGAVSIQNINKQFQLLEKDESIKKIILVLDTPGGEVAGISEFSKSVNNSKKEVIAFVDGEAASAGYWIASAASKIVVTDTSLVGSVGAVITVKRDTEDNNTVEFVSSVSPNKRAKPDTDEGKQSIQALVDKIGTVFIETVAENRKVTIEHVLENFGKGGLKLGKEAVQAGMADEIGDFKSLIMSEESDIIIKEDQIKEENMEDYKKGVEDERKRVLAIMENTFTGCEEVTSAAIRDGVTVEDALKSIIAERKKTAIKVFEEINASEPVKREESVSDDMLVSEFNGDEKAYNAYKNAVAKGLVKIKG